MVVFSVQSEKCPNRKLNGTLPPTAYKCDLFASTFFLLHHVFCVMLNCEQIQLNTNNKHGYSNLLYYGN